MFPKYFSGTGDSGKSSLFGSTKRLPKTDLRFSALGDLDGLNSFLGVCKSLTKDEFVSRAIQDIQEDLFVIQSAVGSVANRKKVFSKSKTLQLEQKINEISGQVRPVQSFVISGGTLLSAHLDYARTLARRAERSVLALKPKQDFEIISYLNRLSSLLFVLARLANKGVDEPGPKYA